MDCKSTEGTLRTVKLWQIGGAIFLFKAVYLLGLALALIVWPEEMDVQMFWTSMAHWPPQGPPSFASHFATWDSAHYLYLSQAGYQCGNASCAFYPLWPILIRGVTTVCGANPVVTGIILSNVFSTGGGLLFFWIVSKRWGERVGKLALILLLLFPGSLFFQFILTESLFLLLVMLLVVGLERHNYGSVLAAGFLLPLTRPLGVFCLFPILWKLIGTHLATFRLKRADRKEELLDVRPLDSRFLALFQGAASALILGFLSYFALMKHWTGNAFEGFQAQHYWGNHSIGNLYNVPKFVSGIFAVSAWHAPYGSLLDRSIFALLLSSLMTVWRMDKVWLIWLLVLGVVPAMSGQFVSFLRYVSVAFPLFAGLAVALSPPSRRLWLITLLVVFSILHLVLLWRFVNFRWAA